MKNTYVKELCDWSYEDREICEIFLLKELSNSTNRFSNRWQDGILSDKTGDIQMRVWNENISEEYRSLVGALVKVLGKVCVYQDRFVIEAVNVEPVAEALDLMEFVVSITEEEKRALYSHFQELSSVITEEKYKALFHAVFSSSLMERLSRCPSGKYSGDYAGALLVHTCEVMENVYAMLNGRTDHSVNPSLVMLGAALHDVGKLYMYEKFPSCRRSRRGILISTSVNSILHVTKINNSLSPESRVKDLMELYHIIQTASSSGEDQQKPMTLEAIMVNLANNQANTLSTYRQTLFNADREGKEENSYVYSKGLNRTIVR